MPLTVGIKSYPYSVGRQTITNKQYDQVPPEHIVVPRLVASGVTTQDNVLTAGNGLANLTTTGMTILSGVTGVDDGFAYVPLAMDFSFFGTSYRTPASGATSGLYWNTNNVIGFGTGTTTILWLANTGRGIILGNSDRRTNTMYYSSIQTSKGYDYINFVLSAQNRYNDSIPNAIRWQIRLFRGSSKQYVELRASTAPATAGTYNITNGTAFQNTFGAFTGVTANSSFVLESNLTGSTWTFYNNYYIDI